MFITNKGRGHPFVVQVEDTGNCRTLTLFSHLDLNHAMAFLQGRLEREGIIDPIIEIISGYRKGHSATEFSATHTRTNKFRLGKEMPWGKQVFQSVAALLEHCWCIAPHGHACMVAITLDLELHAFDIMLDEAMETYLNASDQE